MSDGHSIRDGSIGENRTNPDNSPDIFSSADSPFSMNGRFVYSRVSVKF